MKTIQRRFLLSLLGLICLLSDCSKSADPSSTAGAGGCKVTFDGKNYSLSTAVCSLLGTSNVLSSDWYNKKPGTPSMLMSFDTSDPLFAQIEFSDGTIAWTFDYYSGTPTITVSGKSWTFNAIAAFPGNSTKSISGSCTCTVGP